MTDEYRKGLITGMSLNRSIIIAGGDKLEMESFFQTNINGGVKIEKGYLASGFTSSSYVLKTPAALTSSMGSWVIAVKFKVSDFTSRAQTLFGSTVSGKFYHLPSVDIMASSSDTSSLWVGISTSGSSWEYNKSITEYKINKNMWYWLRYIYNGTNYALYISENGVSFTELVTIAEGITPYYSDTYGFGGIACSSSHYAQYVTIDLRDTYISADETIVWGCKGNTTTQDSE